MMRATKSVPPLAEVPTMTRIGFVGYGSLPFPPPADHAAADAAQMIRPIADGGHWIKRNLMTFLLASGFYSSICATEVPAPFNEPARPQPPIRRV